jgi:uncharacterized protein (UPF0335 family)
MSLKSESVAALKSYLDRVERLETERGELGDEIRAIYAEAKAEGFAPKAIRAIIKRRRAKNPAQLDDDDTVLDTYMHAVGMIPESPLAAAVSQGSRSTCWRATRWSRRCSKWFRATARSSPMSAAIRCGSGAMTMAMRLSSPSRGEAAPEKTGKALKKSATVLSIVPSDHVKAAADAAEARSKIKKPMTKRSRDNRRAGRMMMRAESARAN